MLEGQGRELEQRRLDVANTEAREEALCEALRGTRERLQELERRGQDSRCVAEQVEQTLHQVAKRVREARRAARQIRGGARRTWIWR
mmetsp:Transcript_98790/g.295045  ORF Transcript_98790/g.295045 Transcript_98790/m.295045 type:complete len:87 (-) Transcript_98790:25-285(-)